MITFETIGKLELATLKEGDLVQVLGEFSEGDVALMTGKVYPALHNSSNRLVTIANGLKVEVFPTPLGDKDVTKKYVNQQDDKIKEQVNNLHTKREAIEWRSGLRVTDELQLYVHDGVFYLPNVKKLPFTTGAVFNADNWILSELLTPKTPFVSKGSDNARSLYDRFSDTVNVKNYGVVGGGVDDTASFTKCEDYSIVPSGNYTVDGFPDGVFIADSNITVLGCGALKTLPANLLTNQINTPIKKIRTGGFVANNISVDTIANVGVDEYIREPSLTHSTRNDRTFMVYPVLIGGKQDPGQTSDQRGRIEFRRTDDLNPYEWKEPIVLFNDPELTASEPAIGWDDLRGRVWVFFTTVKGLHGLEHGNIGYGDDTMHQHVMWSDTGGDTWSTPIDITEHVKPYNATNAWTSPSEICVTEDGKLYVPVSWLYNQNGVYDAGYIIVDTDNDNNLTFTRQRIRRAGVDSNGTGETQIIQMGDRSLLAMLRDYYSGGDSQTKGIQRFYRSFDGLKWKETGSVKTTNCKAGLGQYSMTSNGAARNTLIMTAPVGMDESHLHRNNLQMWISNDFGNSWYQVKKPIFQDPNISSGYSSVCVTSNGMVHVSSEGDGYKKFNNRYMSLPIFSGNVDYRLAAHGMYEARVDDIAEVCSSMTIPNLAIIKDENNLIGYNNNGIFKKLEVGISEYEFDYATNSLDTSIFNTYYMHKSCTVSSILGDAASILVLSTSSAEPITFTEDETVEIKNRVRFNKTIKSTAIKVYRTKFGWYLAE